MQKIGANTYLLEGGEKWHADQLVAAPRPLEAEGVVSGMRDEQVERAQRPRRERRTPKSLNDYMMDFHLKGVFELTGGKMLCCVSAS